MSATRALRPGIALVLVTVLVSGISNFVNFKAVQGTDVDAWIAVRNAAVAGMLVPIAVLLSRGTRLRLRRTDWLRLAAIGLVGGAVPFLLYFHGFQLAAGEGGAATASLGYRSLFLVATVLGVLVLREKVPRRFAVAAGLLLGGNVLLLSLTGPVWTDGTAYVLLATVLWAAEYTLSKSALKSLPSGTVALGRMGFGAVFLVAYLGITGQASSIAGFGSADWMNLAVSALLLFAFVTTWYAGLKTVDLSVASSMLVLAFPVTWCLSVVTAGRGVSVTQAAGAAAVVAGAGVLAGIAGLRGVWAPLARLARIRLVRGA
ncbi:MAG TPA: EamA family transporter [Thermoplasmata archaeon]|nr:EamA family transporter [Thermoplasmata archaeon]